MAISQLNLILVPIQDFVLLILARRVKSTLFACHKRTPLTLFTSLCIHRAHAAAAAAVLTFLKSRIHTETTHI